MYNIDNNNDVKSPQNLQQNNNRYTSAAKTVTESLIKTVTEYLIKTVTLTVTSERRRSFRSPLHVLLLGSINIITDTHSSSPLK